MARIKNAVFVLLLVFLFVEVLIIFPQHLEKVESESATAPIVDQNVEAEQKMQGVHLVESQKGSRDWELFAKAAEGSHGKGNWELQEVRVQFYNEEVVDFVVTGNSGSIDTQSKDMKIKGDVLIKSKNGYIFESKEVFYNAKARQIVSEKNILMRAPNDEQGEGLQVRGAGMLVYVDQSRMLIKDEIRASKKLKNSKRFELTSESAEFSGKNREARFHGNVVILYDKMKIEGPAATFFYDKQKETLKNIALGGGVRVSDQDKYAISDEMNLDILTNKFVFTGKPRVYQNNDELSGEQIVFLDGGKKVRVENIKARGETKVKN